ncbi:LysE family translocator [Oceanidesulfovibrio indonesiensis]|uniref:LysE family translocator n=1 Tax=Oceanidesulfovibrio indonesiensis TaxID=54767 RepID=A0A7M3MIL6_9BACT|nr:LysE family translocator [Oceanidesulfovibrio indonesiensis]TVM19523.1 LysE family translocator [Oceanidesulfovibrio indonesiensis]
MEGKILSFVLFLLVMTGTPGPGNMAMLAIGQTSGFVSAVPFLIGATMGFAAVNALVACGLGEAFSIWPTTAQILRVLGGLYILYLAVKILRMQAAPPDHARRLRLFEGMLIHPLSPKSWAMSVAAYSQFMPTGNVGPEVGAVFVFAFLVFQVTFHSLWCAAGAGIYAMLKNNRARLAINSCLVALMLGATLYALAA